MERKSFNEVLKAKEAKEAKQNAGANEEMKLDDAARVKVLSPGRLVFKRFIRNKLAIVGTLILLFMFAFSFIGPLFYPYGQTEVFKKYASLEKTFATAQERTEYATFVYDSSLEFPSYVRNSMNSIIAKMTENELEQYVVSYEGVDYLAQKEGENIYSLSTMQSSGTVATYQAPDSVGSYLKTFMPAASAKLSASAEKAIVKAIEAGESTVTVDGETYLIVVSGNRTMVYSANGGSFNYTSEKLDDAFETAAANAALGGQTQFTADGRTYSVTASGNGYEICGYEAADTAYVYSVYSFDTVDSTQVSDEFKVQALYHAYGDPNFTADGVDYTVVNEDGELMVYKADDMENPYALYTTFIVRDYLGQDSYDIEFKTQAQDQILALQEQGLKTGTYVYPLPVKQVELVDETNEETNETTTREVVSYVYDDAGNVKYEDKTIKVELDLDGRYNLRWDELTHQIDRYAGGSKDHPFGTDGDGMDLLARMMYGGRVSLLVGFVVVFLETILGVIMGGISGYFGGWVDNLIMRLVDIFYCIPSTPILIILGSMMDKMKIDPYVRLLYLMAILGILGWAGIARLVRGQILSLREQEFMVATEATGIKVSKRIFRHLLPNVMPQLIVNMTASLGGVILTESTLSFLGLGVRHPLATWGTMINSVTGTNEDMIRYTYIWIPVGLLICLTVIAFNFVGDGLRDAFDPKMKR